MAYILTFETHFHAVVDDDDNITGYELMDYGQLSTLVPTGERQIVEGEHGWTTPDELYDALCDQASTAVGHLMDVVSSMTPDGKIFGFITVPGEEEEIEVEIEYGGGA